MPCLDLDMPGPGSGHAMHDLDLDMPCLDLDMPGPRPRHANINKDNLDMPGTGPGQASINQDNLDIPGSGHGHARTWIWTCHAWFWTCQDLDLDIPISTRPTWTCQELDLVMPGPGPGHAMSWTSSTYIINLHHQLTSSTYIIYLHHQLTSFIEYFTQTLSTIDPRETTLACGDFNINLLSLNSNDHCNTYLEGTLSSGFLPAIDSFLWR